MAHIQEIIDRFNRSEISNELISDDEVDETTEEDSYTVEPDSIESFFRKLKINLSAESRPLVFEALIAFFTEFEGEITFQELTKIMRERMHEKSGVSRRRINEIMFCLFHFDLFRDSDNKPVRNTSNPIHHMASLNPDTFERKCMEFYAEKILHGFDPDFFDYDKNILTFEKLTLGSVPPPEKTQRMKDFRGNVRVRRRE